jgi:hypothetical protein
MNNNHNIAATHWEPSGAILLRKTQQSRKDGREAIAARLLHSVASKNSYNITALFSVAEINSNRKSSPQSRKVKSLKKEGDTES